MRYRIMYTIKENYNEFGGGHVLVEPAAFHDDDTLRTGHRPLNNVAETLHNTVYSY